MDDEDIIPEAIEEEYDDYEEDLEGEIEAEEVEDEEAEEKDELEDYEEEVEAPPENVIQINEEDENHRIVRVLRKDKRITSEIIQWPEMVEAIGIRASQIEQGSPVLTDVSGYTDPIDMAKKEFIDRASPLIIQRCLKKTPTHLIVEWWKVRKMTFPVTNREIQDITTKKITELVPASRAAPGGKKKDETAASTMAVPLVAPAKKEKESPKTSPPSSPKGSPKNSPKGSPKMTKKKK
jgi:DNA-directed RNA polymerase subunit K/omega